MISPRAGGRLVPQRSWGTMKPVNDDPRRRAPAEMMDTHEVADYLRVKERKVYELVRDRKIPCVRVTGKWLFPRALIDEWLIAQTEVPDSRLRPQPPAVLAGSHDPLLEWCVRESGCGLAMLTGGSLDGLAKLVAGEAAAALMHVLDPGSGEYNVPVLRREMPGDDLVAIEWARREQGLVVAAGNPLGITGLADLRARRVRVVRRQAEAGTHVLFAHLLLQAGIAPDEIETTATPARTETDVGMAILEGRADAGPAVATVARTLRLDFVPLHSERCDLVMHRREFFAAPMQRLLALARSPAFAERAQALGGYDIGGLGTVHYNGP